MGMLIQRIKVEPPLERGFYLEKLGVAAYHFRTPTSALRKELVSVIVDHLEGELGPDNGSSEYAENAKRKLRNFIGSSNGTLTTEIISQFADKIVAQPKLTYELRDMRNQELAQSASDMMCWSGLANQASKLSKNPPHTARAYLNSSRAQFRINHWIILKKHRSCSSSMHLVSLWAKANAFRLKLVAT